MTQLSWQPPPVTKCEECEYADSTNWHTCAFGKDFINARQIYSQNKGGITPTCPMWREQNKEKL